MMRFKNLALTVTLICCLFNAAPPRCSARLVEITLSGRVVTKSRPGYADQVFNVKLYPPKDSGNPVLLTATDDSGHFKFTGLSASSYLLEIYLGKTLVYQNVIDMSNGNQDIIIRLD
jgi:hypothetical protein